MIYALLLLIALKGTAKDGSCSQCRDEYANRIIQMFNQGYSSELIKDTLKKEMQKLPAALRVPYLNQLVDTIKDMSDENKKINPTVACSKIGVC